MFQVGSTLRFTILEHNKTSSFSDEMDEGAVEERVLTPGLVDGFSFGKTKFCVTIVKVFESTHDYADVEFEFRTDICFNGVTEGPSCSRYARFFKNVSFYIQFYDGAHSNFFPYKLTSIIITKSITG